MNSRKLSAYAATVLAWTAYFTATLLAPKAAGSNPWGISPLGLLLLQLSIALPYLLTWLAGCYGVLTLRTAVRTMPDKEDAKSFARIADGVLVLLCGLVVTSFLSAARSYLRDAPQATASLTILTNYVYILAPLVGFSFIYIGSGHLRRGTSAADLPRGWGALGALILGSFAALYAWLIYTNPTRQVSTEAGIQASYYLPDALIVATIVLPFLASCVVGLLAVLRLARYYRGVSGYVYKKSTLYFIDGLLFVIFGAVLLQALQSLGSSRLLGIGLGPLLLVIYAFLIAQGLGFVFVALGAKQLSAIERVMSKYAPAEKHGNA
ncbi:MAG TPA: hypothetical protein VL500_07415 [Candidatus Eisenbacteria bacterium]|jgi:hypothetical protein|nr:hypothetical protein [Candidatus Eisenbacteria bacterium]